MAPVVSKFKTVPENVKKAVDSPQKYLHRQNIGSFRRAGCSLCGSSPREFEPTNFDRKSNYNFLTSISIFYEFLIMGQFEK